jgi:predicted O-methyltransferase YrrM
VIDEFSQHLTPESKVFEFGGGGSTLWFSERAGTVVTVEHDPEWFPALAKAVETQPGCTVQFCSAEDEYREYVNAIAAYPDEFFDIVVVDGRERVRCFETAMPKVSPGGLLVLDDTNRDRYAKAFTLAKEWPSHTYRGLTPAKTLAGVTTVWQRPT